MADIKKIISKVVSEMQFIEETDLLAPDKTAWNEMKKNFKDKIEILLQNIEDDNYDDATNEIDQVISILNVWQNRIKKSL